jgi:thioredoxin 1
MVFMTVNSREQAAGNNLFNNFELTDKTIIQSISEKSFFVLEFYYPGCRACNFLNKTTSELSNELQGQVRFGKMDVRSNRNTIKNYKIIYSPTLLFFNEGILVNRVEGNISKSDLVADLKEFKPDLDTRKVKSGPTSLPSSITIPSAKLGDSKLLMPMMLSDDNLKSALRRYPYLVADAYTKWCEQCRYMNNTLSTLSMELQGQVAFGLIDMDLNKETKTKYNITAYPTILIFKDSKLVGKVIGNKQKSVIVDKLKKIEPKLNTNQVKIAQAKPIARTKPKLTPEQVCINMTKSDQPLLQAFIVSRSPFGLQIQRIMASIIGQSNETEKYLKVSYIGSVNNSTIYSMHGKKEAQENLRQICIREEQTRKYWDYVSCYMKEGKSTECLKSASLDQRKLDACINDSSRGLAYAQKDFDLANKLNITKSPTLTMNGKVVNELNFATCITNGRSPEGLKELLCRGFNTKPPFCSKQLNTTEAITMFSVKPNSTAKANQQLAGRDIPLSKLGLTNPTQAMLVTDYTIDSGVSRYPLLVVEAYVGRCGFCRKLNFTVSELVSELQEQVAFGLIDMDRNKKTKAKYNITTYPTILIFKNGKLIDRVIGNKQKSVLVTKLKQIEPKLDTSMVKVILTPLAPPKPK